MIHEMAAIEKVLQKYEDYAVYQQHFYAKDCFKNPEDRKHFQHYYGWEICIRVIRHDLEILCEQEEKEMLSAQRLSDIIEAPNGFYRVKTVMNGPSGLPGER